MKNIRVPDKVLDKRKKLKDELKISWRKAFLLHDELVAEIIRKRKRKGRKTVFEIELKDW